MVGLNKPGGTEEFNPHVRGLCESRFYMTDDMDHRKPDMIAYFKPGGSPIPGSVLYILDRKRMTPIVKVVIQHLTPFFWGGGEVGDVSMPFHKRFVCPIEPQ